MPTASEPHTRLFELTKDVAITRDGRATVRSEIVGTSRDGDRNVWR